ncbi:unnamed protein product [Echinostoma caproni]|uniref:DDE_3 domain-containing protein n=1 Tax=Echinostoma caproni TaxID=27848 RepID=A0A183B7X4_9TREM|nr:unnamed protein product [Echinostoma caproni]
MAVPWLPLIPHEMNDVELVWERIRDGILHLTDTFSPANRSIPQTLRPPWFDPELPRLLRRRNRTWQAFRATGAGYDLYWRIQNEFTELKRSKRWNFEEQLAQERLLNVSLVV